MSDALAAYTREWNAKPWWWRAHQRVWWVWSSFWNAVRGRPGPGEQRLLQAWKSYIDECCPKCQAKFK